MEVMEGLEQGLTFVGELLAHEVVEPDPERSDWGEYAGLMDTLRDGFRECVLEPFGRVQRELADHALFERARMAVCNAGASVIAVLYASGARDDAERVLAELRPVAAPVWQEELDAARRDIRHFALLMYGRWLLGEGKPREARAVLDRVIAGSREPALLAEAHAWSACAPSRSPARPRCSG